MQLIFLLNLQQLHFIITLCRVYWLSIFLLMICITFTSISVLINVWINSPMVLFIENSESAISEIPFPQITICSSNQIRKSVWEKYKNTNSSYWDYLQQYQTLICSSHAYAEKSELHSRKYLNNKIIKNLTNDNAISCTEMFQYVDVEWQNTTITNFCNQVQPITSIIGQCFAYNMMPSHQLFQKEYYQRWNEDHGYTSYPNDNIQLEVIPARTSGVSYYHRLVLRLHTLFDDFLGCPTHNLMEGFILIVLSNPADYYMVRTKSFIIPNTHTKIQITPFVKKISSDLKWRSPSVRKCYLPNERNLSIFQHYNEANCNQECIINETISMCGCMSYEVALWVPLGLAGKEAKICGPSNKMCISRAEQSTFHPALKSVCNCLPSCTSIDYEVVDTARFDNWTYLKTTKLAKNNSIGATVEFIFKHPYFTAHKASSVLDLNSLFSVIGGTLGLFLGLNFISFFEIVYVIIRAMCYYVGH